MRSVVKVLAVLALIWVGFIMLGAVLKFLVWALVIGGILFVGAAAYSALTSGKKDRPAIRN